MYELKNKTEGSSNGNYLTIRAYMLTRSTNDLKRSCLIFKAYTTYAGAANGPAVTSQSSPHSTVLFLDSRPCGFQ